jgi:acyl-CoA synthetase (NDP forming)
MDRWGYPGEVGLVSRNAAAAARAGGKWPWFPDVSTAADRIGDIDLAVLFVGTDHVMDALRSCAAANVAGAIVLANAGGGAELSRLGGEICDLSVATGIRIVGPGSAGLLVGALGLPASLMRRVTTEAPLRAPGVAILATSGALANELLWGLARQGVRVGLWMTLGPESDVTIGEVMEVVAPRPDVTSVVTIIESLRDGAAYLRGAQAVVEAGKSVLAHRLMTSDAAGPIAALHTGSARVPGALWRSAARACGVVSCESLPDLGWSALWLDAIRGSEPRPTGVARIAVVTISGGGGVTAIDQGVRRGVEFTDHFQSHTVEALRALGIPPLNPVDVGAALARPPVELLQSVVEKVAADPGVDAVWCQAAAALYNTTERAALVDGLAAAGSSLRKPVIISSLVGWPYEYVDRRRDLIVSVPSLDNAIVALATQAEVGRRLGALRVRPASRPIPAAAGLRAGRRLSEGLRAVGQWSGFRVPKWWALETADPLEKAARLVAVDDFPVVAKADSMAHKARAGQVALNIGTPDDLRRALEALRQSGGGPLVVQQQVGGIHAEVLMGCVASDEVGEVAVLGRGGVDADADDQRIVLPLPAARAAVAQAVDELAAAWPDQSVADARDLIEAGFSRLIGGFLGRDPSVTGIELNPVILAGADCWVVDVRIAVRDGDVPAGPAVSTP